MLQLPSAPALAIFIRKWCRRLYHYHYGRCFINFMLHDLILGTEGYKCMPCYVQGQLQCRSHSCVAWPVHHLHPMDVFPFPTPSPQCISHSYWIFTSEFVTFWDPLYQIVCILYIDISMQVHFLLLIIVVIGWYHIMTTCFADLI